MILNIFLYPGGMLKTVLDILGRFHSLGLLSAASLGEKWLSPVFHVKVLFFVMHLF